MSTTNCIGIWMDHSNAHLMEFTNEIKTNIIVSEFNHREKKQSLSKSENLMHNKEQQQQGEYYKKLGEIIKNYEEVVLFGPTDAKVELYNLLKADHIFSNIKIDVKQADKMTKGQEEEFVRNFFTSKS